MFINCSTAGQELQPGPRGRSPHELQFGLLKEVPVTKLDIRRNTYLIFPKTRPPRELVASFIDFVKSRDPAMMATAAMTAPDEP